MIFFLPLIENFDPHAIEFIEGMAAGASISFEEAMMIRAAGELMFFYAGKIPGLCISFAATGKAIKNGKTFLGQNLEAFDGIQVALLRIKRIEGVKQLLLAYGGTFEFGLNSTGIGICCTATLAYHDIDHNLNIPTGCYLSKVMRQRIIGRCP